MDRKSRIGIFLAAMMLIFAVFEIAGSGSGPTDQPSPYSAGPGDKIAVPEAPEGALGSEMAADQPEISLDESEPMVAPSHSLPAWRKPLDELIAAGHSGADPSAAILRLLRCEPGMGDRLLSLLLELDGSQDERDALTVALATALTFDPGSSGPDGISWPEGMESLWHDRSETILVMAQLWIEGDSRAKYFQRLLKMDAVLAPWHSIELAVLLENSTVGLDEECRTRLQQLVEHSLSGAGQDAVAIAREWIESGDPTLQGVALRTIGRSLASEPKMAREWIESVPEQERISLLEAVLSHVPAHQLKGMIDQTADLMLEQEYRGAALLESFSRGTQLDLESIVYQRGDSHQSESFRNLVLYASQGGISRGDRIPARWSHALQSVAQTDPSRSVRCTALRICALSWPSGDLSGFEQLIRRSDVDPRTAEIAHALLIARESTRWSLND
ncbi:MAG: hypothetical protein VX404_00560 [Planctomycetota bacterium]|nr:hypothetical protein [Planctomycetota bacterium]